MSVRQHISAAPYALQTRGLFADPNLNVGVGTSSPARKLDVKGRPPFAGLGFISSTTSSRTVTGGGGTAFTSEVKPGDTLIIQAGGPMEQRKVVESVISDTQLTVTTIFFPPLTNSVYQIRQPTIRATDDQGNTILSASAEGAAGLGMVPIGAIVAWHKSMNPIPGIETLGVIPPLPAGWEECDGSSITDPASPMKGQVKPDLNSTPADYSGGGRFLRGGTTSGILQHATQICNQNDPGGDFMVVRNPIPSGSDGDNSENYVYGNFTTLSTPTRAGNTAYARPVNMSVVWIIRVN